MKGATLGVFAVLGVFLFFAFSAGGEPSDSSVGAVLSGDSVWWGKPGIGTITVTPAVIDSGREVDFDFTSEPASAGSVNVGAWFENGEGLVKVFRVLRERTITEYNLVCSMQQVFNETTSQLQNHTTCSSQPSERLANVWVDVAPEVEVVNGRTYYYITLDAVERVKAVVKATALGSVKYNVAVKRSFDAWDSVGRVEVDPVVNGVDVPVAVFYSSYDFNTSDEASGPSAVTEHGSPRINTSSYKVGTGSVYLDGNSWLTLPRNDVANKTNLTGNMTVTAWINVTQTGVYSSIIGESTSRTGCGSAPGGNCGTYLGLWSISNHLSGGVAHTNTTNSIILNGGSTINTNTWYFVVWRYDVTANNFSLILNAAETQQTTPGTAWNNHPAADYITIGNKSEYILQDGVHDAFKGHIDTVCIFNEALNVTQINALYSSGTGEPCPVSASVVKPNTEIANEEEGDNAIEAAINSSVPSARKYKTQKVYVVNSSNSQWQGTVDYFVVQDNPPKRWLLNYINGSESYLNAKNLSNVVYVLELTNKSAYNITQEVSTLINATK